MEKQILYINACGMQKNGIDEPTCRAGIEKQTQRKDMWTEREGNGKMNWESRTDIYTLPCVKQIANENLLYNQGVIQ